MRRIVSLLAALSVALSLTAIASAAQIDTFAGSGAAGFGDGPAQSASFVMPEGLAVAPNGDVYVADTGAQRIRRVSNGTITTLAGSGALDASRLWVAGGYANGPAASARFNEPKAVAVSSSGDVVVADTANHCLRVISGGSVSDYAGTCGRAGNSDGTRASALFTNPVTLAFDARGTLFVGDFGTGVRKITSDGTVTTIALPAPFTTSLTSVTGLSLYEGGTAPLLFVAAGTGIYIFREDGVGPIRFYQTGPWESYADNSQFIAGSREFGHPYAVAAVDDSDWVYTDITTNAVRYFASTMTGMAIGMPIENAGFEAGGYRDGDSAAGRVDQPMGLVRRADGSFVVADTGNRRLRLVSGIDFRNQSTISDIAADKTNYRIVYIGASEINSNQVWSESIAGIVERNLRGNWRSLGFPRPPKVYPFQLLADLNAMKEYVNTYLASGVADMVILQLGSGQVYMSLKQPPSASLDPYAAQWQPLVASSVRDTASELAKVNIPLAVVLAPSEPYEVSPVEASWLRFNKNFSYTTFPAPPNDYLAFDSLFRQALDAAGVPFADAFPAFWSAETSRDHPALFAARDPHYSVAGAALVAQVISEYLLRTRPWTKK
ncbi:MAG: hypothetical protein JO192_02745 [Candidatus Eremiobacteraeota bacterium]|nr:hypothetical protein [Candidatus Eremiobacteraeota bacterium]MBV8331627.1 hypothetical protein [Candidatus Eremiobacteraeota bacterium]